MSRADELLDAVLESLDRYEDPFHESFLRKHNVTLDEACALADSMHAGLTLLRMMAQGIPNLTETVAESGDDMTVVLDAIGGPLSRLLSTEPPADDEGDRT